MSGPVAVFGASLCLALGLTPVAMRVAWRRGTLDRADGQRKLHASPVPLLGGVAVWLATVGALALAWALNQGAATYGLLPTAPWLFAASLACLLGWRDDVRGLRVRWKLLGQFAAATPLVVSGSIVHRLEGAGLQVELGWLAIPFTYAWLLAGMNAVNFIDGIDGLASTVGAIAAAGLALAIGDAHPSLAIAAAALSGALVGFLWYNRPPAGIYLGDAGSLPIGLLLAALAIPASTVGATGDNGSAGAVRLAALFAWLGAPLLDLGLAVARRLIRTRCFWVADREHVHHRLLARGFSAGAVDLQFAILTAGLAGIARLACGATDWVAWGALAAGGALAMRFRWAGHEEWRLLSNVVRFRLLRALARPAPPAAISRPALHVRQDEAEPRVPPPKSASVSAPDGQRKAA